MESGAAFQDLLHGYVVFGEVFLCGFHLFLYILPQKLGHLEIKPHFPCSLLNLLPGIQKQVPHIHQVLPRHQNWADLPMDHPDLVVLVDIRSRGGEGKVVVELHLFLLKN